MAITPGTRLGVFDISEQIGRGGMGEVYRATDTKLKRQVAIKILPPSFAADHDRLARFQREAQVLASLNHPNIAAIYGLEESGGMTALVMELVEGDDLSQRIARGAIPLDDALPIATQIAEALEAAHEQGIIHRDLKPANIKVRSDGTVKVLDFGLAKAMEPVGALSPVNSMSPTITSPAMTQAGMILGTAAYMSPEQARGKPVDKRADIWAFGAVLFEMLTGQRAFPGEDLTDTLAAVVKLDPAWDAVGADVPSRVRQVLRVCLQKNPKQRGGDIAAIRLALEGAFETTAPHATAPVDVPQRRRGAIIGAATLLAGAVVSGALVWAALRPAALAPPLAMALTVLPPDSVSAREMVALSPDGQFLAFTARSDGQQMLWIRSLRSTTAVPLAGTANAVAPFWSPDSRSVAFSANGKLNRISATGGPVQALADTAQAFPGAWNEDGVILFTPSQFASIARVSASGGSPVPVTTLDAAKNESSHRHPRFLPGGRHFLYSVVTNNAALVDVRVGDIESGETTPLAQSDTEAAYVRTPAGGDYLLFTRQATLLAQPFDLERLQVTGEPTPVTEEGLIRGARAGEGSWFSASASGVIAYRPGGAVADRRLMWTDRAGKPLASVGAPGLYEHLELAPDGTHVALSSIERRSQQLDIWLMDVAEGASTRFTFEPGEYGVPHWSADGGRLTFSRTNTRKGMYEKPSNGAGSVTQVFPSPHEGLVTPNDWSSDGRFLVFTNTPPGQPGTLSILPQFGDRRPVQALRGEEENAPRNGRFSPDGRWLAYESRQAGRIEVSVQPFPASGAKWQISRNGGVKPRWRRDGKELYFVEQASGALMAASITGGADFQSGVPTPLFTLQYGSRLVAQYPYDVSPDGQRFVIIAPVSEAGITPITVLLNWSGAPAK